MCPWDDSMLGSDDLCVVCEWDDSIIASNPDCKEPEEPAKCELDESLLATDELCVVCEWDDSILASNPDCKEPENPEKCQWDEDLLATDELCVEPKDDDEEEDEDKDGEVGGVTDVDKPEVKGTTDVVLAETGASDTTLVYFVQMILVLGTLVSSAIFVKKFML